MSPAAFRATKAATVRPLGKVIEAVPMPPFIPEPPLPPNLPTVAPAPAPTLPSAMAPVVASFAAA